MNIKLRPGIKYELSDEDKLLSMELAKIGFVSFLSNHVLLLLNDNGGQFKEYSLNNKEFCPGLILPSNWAIEDISVCKKGVLITFGVYRSDDEVMNA